MLVQDVRVLPANGTANDLLNGTRLKVLPGSAQTVYRCVLYARGTGTSIPGTSDSGTPATEGFPLKHELFVDNDSVIELSYVRVCGSAANGYGGLVWQNPGGTQMISNTGFPLTTATATADTHTVDAPGVTVMAKRIIGMTLAMFPDYDADIVDEFFANGGSTIQYNVVNLDNEPECIAWAFIANPVASAGQQQVF